MDQMAKKKILVIDDDITLLEMYKERLELANFQVEIATNGEEGLKKVQESKPDLILLDVMMPRVNGFDVIESLKKDQSTASIPVIMLTALVQETSKLRAQESGAVGYIIKSETMPGEVIKQIEETINNKQKD